MKVNVYTGANTTRIDACVKTELEEHGGATLRLDLADTAEEIKLLEAACQLDLFGTSHVIYVNHVEKLSEEAAKEIANAQTDTLIVGKSNATFTKKIERALGDTVTVTKHNAPKGKTLTTELKALAQDEQVVLSAAALKVLEDKCGNDLPRARSIFRQLSAAGFDNPSASQVEVLAGSAEAAPAPWDVTDALDSGRISDMLDIASQCEPVPTAMWVCDHVLMLLRVAEAGWNAEQASQNLGIHKFRASKLVPTAKKFGVTRLSAAAKAATGLDKASKGFNASSRVALVLSQVSSALFG